LAGKQKSAERVEEPLPHRVVRVHDQRLRQADGPRVVAHLHTRARLAPDALAQPQHAIVWTLAHLLLGRVAAAHVAPRRRALDALDLGVGDAAVVLAQLAGFLAQADLAAFEVKAMEARFRRLLLDHRLPGQAGHAERAHDVAVGRHHHFDVEQALEGRHQRLVPRGRALEHDALAAVVAIAHHLVEVVLGHRDQHRREGLLAGGAALHEADHVLLHEDPSTAAPTSATL
jgi:hypothetical protein